jgi:hypothetical protein
MAKDQLSLFGPSKTVSLTATSPVAEKPSKAERNVKAQKAVYDGAVKTIMKWLESYELSHLNWWSRFRAVIDLWFYGICRDDEKYLRCVEELGKPATRTAAEMFGVLIVDMLQYPQDILGSIYQQIGANDKRFAQFFTPNAVSTCMAKMVLTGLKKSEFEKPEGLRLCEPCVGSGTMVLSALREIRDSFGDWGVERTCVTAIDKDLLCCKMAAIQVGISPFKVREFTVYCGDSLGPEEELQCVFYVKRNNKDV